MEKQVVTFEQLLSTWNMGGILYKSWFNKPFSFLIKPHLSCKYIYTY